MRRRTWRSLLILAVMVPVAVVSLMSWSRNGGGLANALFQASGSIVVMIAFFGILFPAAARWALRVGGTMERGRRSPLTRLMADLDEDTR